MSKISIQDLADDIELDQAAMRAIMGGARSHRERALQQATQSNETRSALRLMQIAKARKGVRL